MSIQVASAAVNVVRDGHFELLSGLLTRATLLEKGFTNQWTWSEDFSNGAWSNDGTSTVTANAAIAPDGALTGDKIIDTAATSDHYVYRSLAAPSDNTNQTLSVFAKAGERSWLRLWTIDKAGNNRFSWINLSTGALGTVSGSHTVRVTEYVNGWYRCVVTFSAGAGGGTVFGLFALATGDGVGGYLGNGTSGLYLWGAQFERDTETPTSYIVTAGATVARSTDTIYFPFPYTPQAMTVYLKFVERGTVRSSSGGMFDVAASTGAAPRFLVEAVANVYQVEHHNGLSGVASALVTAPVYGDVVELRAILNADGSVQLGQSINSAAETLSTASATKALATAWSDTRFYLNGNAASNAGFNAFLAVKVMRGVQTLTTMRAA